MSEVQVRFAQSVTARGRRWLRDHVSRALRSEAQNIYHFDLAQKPSLTDYS